MISVPEIKTILIPVDGSEHASKAALLGATIASKFGARVILLHILLRDASLAQIYDLARTQEIPADILEKLKPLEPAASEFSPTFPVRIMNPSATTELLVEIGRRILEAERHAVEGQGVSNVDLLMEDDNPASKIIEIAKREKADFIFMGRRGLGMLDEMLSGSVSTKVSHRAQTTVVSVN